MLAAPSSTPGSHGFRPDIEGLRGIAILLVVAYHVGLPGITGGYIGVDVFFVLSGYLITNLLAQEVLSTGRLDFMQFYARRGRRLLPAAVVVLAATMIAGWTILSPTEIHDLTTSVTSASAYVSNALFAYRATNYLADDARGNPVLHTWSLAVEEQFYLFWPLLVTLALRPRRGAREVPEDRRKARLIRIIAVISALSLLLSVILTTFAQAWAFFGAPARVWEFGAGALATLLEGSIVRRYDRSIPYLAWSGVSLLIIAVTVYDTNTHFPGIAAILPVFATIVLLISGSGPAIPTATRFLRTRVLQLVGRLSYSWYLWHWPVLTFAWILWPQIGIQGRFLCAILALLLSALTYYTIEMPVRYWRTFVINPRASMVGTLALTAIGVLGAQAVRLLANRASAGPSQIVFTQAHADFTLLTKDGCTLSYWGTDPPTTCTFGDTSSDTTVALFGDSHADHWFPAMQRIALQRHWRLLTFSKSECPSAAVELESRKLGRTYTECARWRSAVMGQLLQRKPMLVVLSNSSAYVPLHGMAATEWQVSADSWSRGTRATAAALSKASIHTLLLEDVLRPNFNVPICLARRAWSSLWKTSHCTFERRQSINADVTDAEQRGIRGLRYATFADVNPRICHTASCQTERGDIVLYRDSHHLTGTFSESLAPWLLGRMTAALANPEHGSYN
jgi:peptidoglycan/LPS O-acetylase OafA/YrhL